MQKIGYLHKANNTGRDDGNQKNAQKIPVPTETVDSVNNQTFNIQAFTTPSSSE